jgi:probable HAF family extracellular repeat protein
MGGGMRRTALLYVCLVLAAAALTESKRTVADGVSSKMVSARIRQVAGPGMIESYGRKLPRSSQATALNPSSNLLVTKGAGNSVGQSTGQPGNITAAVVPSGQTSQALTLFAPAYTLTDLTSLGLASNSSAQAINNSGDVTGWLNGGYLPSQLGSTGCTIDAFLYNGASFINLGGFGGATGCATQSQGYGINGSGWVTGSADNAGADNAFLYNGTSMVNLGVLQSGSFSIGTAINASGQVTGYGPSSAGPNHAFLYNGASMVDLSSLFGSGWPSQGYGINDSGMVTGWTTVQNVAAGGTAVHAFLYSTASGMVDLGTLSTRVGPNSGNSYGYAINASGWVTGYSNTGGPGTFNQPSDAFLYNGTSMVDLGRPAGANFSQGNAINATGQVAGQCIDATSGYTYACLYNGASWINLNNYIAGSDLGCLATATGINDAGQIVGTAFTNSQQCASDEPGNRGFLLTPGPTTAVGTLSFPATPSGYQSTTEGTISSTINATLQVNSAITWGSTPVNIPASEGGNQEFTVGTISGCTIAAGQTTNSGSTCTIPITFAPAYPGLRTQQMIFTDNLGNKYVFGLSGMGFAPRAAIGPAVGSSAITSVVTGLGGPTGVAEDSQGGFYVAGAGDDQIWYVAPGGASALFGGSTTAGVFGYSGDGGAVGSALFFRPRGVALDSAGNVYIADTGNNRVRVVNAATGIISNFAGNGSNTIGPDGLGGPAVDAYLYQPTSVATDAQDNVYLCDSGQRVLEVSSSTGNITLVAGLGSSYGDNGPATEAKLSNPIGVAAYAGNIYIADNGDNTVRKVDTTGTITTIAGIPGNSGYAGDGGLATNALLNAPYGVAVDAGGSVYIADSANQVVRRVDAVTGIITTVAGPDSVNIGANIQGLAMSGAGDLYMTVDFPHSLVKASISSAAALTFPATNVGNTSANQYLTVANSGNEPLTVYAPYTQGTTHAGDFTGETLTTSSTPPLVGGEQNCPAYPVEDVGVANGGSCLAAVAFTPTAGGSLNGTVSIQSCVTAVNCPTQTATLSGHGVVAAPATSTVFATNLPPSTSTYGQSVTLQVSVTSNSTAVTTGQMTFTDSINTLTNNVVNVGSGGTASYTTSGLSAGSHTITASYGANSSYQSSSMTAGITVSKAGLTVTANNLNMAVNTTVPVLTATITGLVNGDTISGSSNIFPLVNNGDTLSGAVTGKLSLATTATSSSTAAGYPITAGTSGLGLAASNYTINFVQGTLTVSAITYLVGDAYPFTADIAGDFGQGSLNTLSLITTLRAVTNLAGFLPAACSDRFDAMDSYPLDGSGNPTILAGRPGGDGLLNTLDLIETLKRVTNIDNSRPTRTPRGITCANGAASVQSRRVAATSPEASLEFGTPVRNNSGGWRMPVLLRANVNLDLQGFSFSAGDDNGHDSVSPGVQLNFVSAGQQPGIVDRGVPGQIAIVWLEGWQAKAGEVIVGYLETSLPADSLRLHGVSANAVGSGREVSISLPRQYRRQR